MAISGGTRLRHINSSRLDEIENILESLPYKVEIVGVNTRSNGEWYVHFLVPETAFESMPIEKKVQAKTNQKRKKI